MEDIKSKEANQPIWSKETCSFTFSPDYNVWQRSDGHKARMSRSLRKARGLNLPSEEIARMYVEEELEMQTIANHFHVDITTI